MQIYRFSQSKQMLLELFVQYVFPQTSHFVFRSKSLPTSFGGTLQHEERPDGKTIALFGHSGAHAEQWNVLESFPQFAGLITSAFPSLNAKTLLGQNSMHRGLPVLAHPSHLSEKIVGNHGPSEYVNSLSLAVVFWGNTCGCEDLSSPAKASVAPLGAAQ